MSDDPFMVGFVRLKSLLIEAQEEWGTAVGQWLVAAAMRFHNEHPDVSTVEAYYGIVDEARKMKLDETSIDVGEPTHEESDDGH